MFTDAFVTYAVECFAEYAHLSQNVYQYRYVHQGEFGLNPDAGIDKLGKFDDIFNKYIVDAHNSIIAVNYSRITLLAYFNQPK
jgi:hypothetical protein